MKLIGVLFCVTATAVCSANSYAQTNETETKSKITIKEGREVTVTGCMAPAAGGARYILTNVADKKGALHDYVLVSDRNDLAKHVGHRVQLRGKATDRGDAKVETETKTTTKVEGGAGHRETHGKSGDQGRRRRRSTLPWREVREDEIGAAACS